MTEGELFSAWEIHELMSAWTESGVMRVALTRVDAIGL
jgi:hypothetical protein